MISRVLENKPGERRQLEEFLSPVMSPNSKWTLVYRASKHGWSPEVFHSKCDNKSSTLTIVRVKDFIFGGYTDQNWAGKYITIPIIKCVQFI